MNETSSLTKIEGKNFMLEVYNDPFNKRIRIDDYRGNMTTLLQKAEELAVTHTVEKLIFKGREEHFTALLECGFQLEAVINHYFHGSDAYLFCKYYTVERRNNEHWLTENKMVQSISQLTATELLHAPQGYSLIKADETMAEELSILYREVFEIYPTPLHDPEYISKTISVGTIYYTFIFQNKIVSAASAEINNFYQNAELTDCATVKEHRKFGLMKFILRKLEEDLQDRSIFCTYSIARSLSFGMNALLFQLGYSYRGRLMNNCYIYDKLENMNVWVKDLSSL